MKDAVKRVNEGIGVSRHIQLRASESRYLCQKEKSPANQKLRSGWLIR